MRVGLPLKPAHIARSTEPVLTILYSFESLHSQLSNEYKFVENGSVYRKIWSISVLHSGQKLSSRPLILIVISRKLGIRFVGDSNQFVSCCIGSTFIAGILFSFLGL